MVENKILSKTDKLWIEIAEKCGLRRSTLYSYVVKNTFGLKDYLLGRNSEHTDSDDSNEDYNNDSNGNLSFHCPGEFSFVTRKKDFEDLLQKKICYVKRGNKRARVENVILKSGVWTDSIYEKIYSTIHKHAFHFKDNYIYKNELGGNLKGLYAHVVRHSIFNLILKIQKCII